MSSKNVRLSREIIAAAALTIADTEGFAAVSMRRVAQELNVGTMSLYHYVKTRDDLIAAMDDALLSEALLPSVPRDWKRAITEIATRTHALFLRHPWALVSMASAPPGRNAMLHMEQCLQALSQTKLTAEQKLTFLAMVDDFVFGSALRESAGEVSMDMEFVSGQLATGEFPLLTDIFRNGRVDARTDRFEIGLRLLLDSHRSWLK